MSQAFPVAALLAWLLAAAYYFYQYALRSAPSVMMPQLSDAFGVDALGAASIVGMFYYGYSPFSLVAGAAMDRFGAKRIIPIGAALVGTGALLFSTGDVVVASLGDSCKAPAECLRSSGRSTLPPSAFRRPTPHPSSAPPRCSAWRGARRASSSWDH
jgi:MFS family permease